MNTALSERVCFFLPVDGPGHAPDGVADAPDGDGVGLNILRQSHAVDAGIADMVNIRPGHFAHQGDLPDGGGVGSLQIGRAHV